MASRSSLCFRIWLVGTHVLLLQACSSPLREATTTADSSVNLDRMVNLDTYRWKNRLLLVFAPSENDSNYQRQIRLLKEHQPDLEERDLLLIGILSDGSSPLEQHLDKVDGQEMRDRFNSPEKFQAILLGKDGTVKRRDEIPVSPEMIFQEIDAMPMRQREMRERSGG